MTVPQTQAKALHTWSLFRTLGRFVAPGSAPGGDLTESDGPAPDLVAFAQELAEHGYTSVQLCHFYLASTEPGYLVQVRSGFERAGVELECLLVDDGDLTHPTDADAQQAWISDWISVGEQLGTPRVRVPAGRATPTAQTLRASAERLTALARRHPGIRLVTENWRELLPDATSVTTLLDATQGEVGLLLDLGNWSGLGKYDELAAVAARAETCQAKVRSDAAGELDLDDYRTSLTVLRDAGYAGPLAMVYDGADDDEWGRLEQAYAVVREVFPSAGGDADR